MSEPLQIPDDPATWAWLQQQADQRYRGDLGRCVAEVLRAARIQAEQFHHQGVSAGELGRDPWGPLDDALHQRRTDTTT
jgi:hypothetical protein